MLKNYCFWTVVLGKTLESPLDCKEVKPVNPKRNQSWIFIGRTDAKTEAPILWSPDAKIKLITKDYDAEKAWRQEEKGMTEDKRVGWHHWPNGHGLDGITDLMNMSLSKPRKVVKDREAWHAAVHGIAKSWTQLSN